MEFLPEICRGEIVSTQKITKHIFLGKNKAKAPRVSPFNLPLKSLKNSEYSRFDLASAFGASLTVFIQFSGIGIDFERADRIRQLLVHDNGPE